MSEPQEDLPRIRMKNKPKAMSTISIAYALIPGHFGKMCCPTK